MISFPPAILFIAASFLLPFLSVRLRNWFLIILPLIVLFFIYHLDSTHQFWVQFLNFDINLLRVDEISKLFGYVFCIVAFGVFVFGYYQNTFYEQLPALIYMGAALGVVFAADLVSLYLFWELMAVGSVFLIFLGRRKKSIQAGYRYFLAHLVSGLLLLVGVLLYIHQTGSIAFDGFDFQSMSTYLILISFLINAGFVPFTSWMTDAYPESSPMGGVILCAFTSKTAVYALLRGFPGWDILIIIGGVMTLYAVIYAVCENDIKKVLTFSIINQVGFMICGIGIGTPLALAGVVAHAVCCVLYKALLFMSVGAVYFRTGLQKCTELGGLARLMPRTCFFAIVGALSIAAFPLTSGFVSKSIVILAAEKMHLFLPWLVLEFASATVFLHAGLKYPYFTFFNRSFIGEQEVKEAPSFMLIAMGVMTFFAIFIGIYPSLLYDLLPFSDLIKSVMGASFYDVYIHHFLHVLSKLQMLFFSALAFFLFLPVLKHQEKIILDFDWVYRKGFCFLYRFFDLLFNGLNRIVHRIFIDGFVGLVNQFFVFAPGYLLWMFIFPFKSLSTSKVDLNSLTHVIKDNRFSIGVSGIFVLILMIILFV